MSRKSQFVLIDHSLKKVGGHHYEYAARMLRAAEVAGFQPVLAAHRSFRDHRELPASWPVFSIFCHHGYSRYTLGSGKVSQPVNPFRTGSATKSFWPNVLDLPRWWRELRERRDLSRQRARVLDFADGCEELVRRIGLSWGDQVLLPTLTEFDLIGLVRFLRIVPETLRADWHVQFHDGFLDGREADYDRQQDTLAAVRDHFRELLDTVPRHRLHCYSITPQLAAQYNRLNLAPFELLRYPVHPDILQHPLAINPPSPTLRVLCSSPLRDATGSQFLTRVIHDLWYEHVAHDRLQLQVRAKRSRDLPRLPSEWVPAARNTIVRIPLALSPREYTSWICGADIGLFLYDSRRYYAKCSGMLTEMLCAGVPVILPAGCWLSAQIAESVYEHLDELSQSLPLVRQLRGDEVEWRTGNESATTLATELDVPDDAQELLIRFRLPPEHDDAYIRWQWAAIDARGPTQNLGTSATVCGQRAEEHRPLTAMFHVPCGVKRLRLTVRNAFEETRVALSEFALSDDSLSNVSLSFHSSSEFAPGHCPAGKVGLIAADRDQIPALLRDMIEHYSHYRQSAQEFARSYRSLHDPHAACEQLVYASQISADRPQAGVTGDPQGCFVSGENLGKQQAAFLPSSEGRRKRRQEGILLFR